MKAGILSAFLSNVTRVRCRPPSGVNANHSYWAQTACVGGRGSLLTLGGRRSAPLQRTLWAGVVVWVSARASESLPGKALLPLTPATRHGANDLPVPCLSSPIVRVWTLTAPPSHGPSKECAS